MDNWNASTPPQNGGPPEKELWQAAPQAYGSYSAPAPAGYYRPVPATGNTPVAGPHFTPEDTFKTPPSGEGARKRAGRRARPAQTALSAAAVVIAAVLAVSMLGFVSLAFVLAGMLSPAPYINSPPANSFSVVQVVGAIQNLGNDPYSTQPLGYFHDDTVAYIKQLTEDDGNLGILLYMNTPGGGVYESDEVYLALKAYKEATGRPVWAYMADMCASGGYYIAAAADYIISNRNTTTGSIGVYIAMADTSGLYGKLGIETVLVKSGNHKGTGIAGVPVTDEQIAVYQEVVDESYEQFVSLIADGRGLPSDAVYEMADGRIYTGLQALDLGLVDEIGDFDTAMSSFEEETGGAAYWPSFARQSQFARLIGGLLGSLPVGDAEALLAEAASLRTGEPMAIYNAD